MTHAEAAALYPRREPFGTPGRPRVGAMGRAFADAKARAAALGLAHVRDGDALNFEAERPDGVILPGLFDDDPPVSDIARWLGAVTLYYQPRAQAVAK